LSSYNEDYYRFVVDSGEELTISLTPHINQGDLDAIVYDQYQNSVASRYNVLNGNTGTITYTVTIGGAYYLKVVGGGGAYGNYEAVWTLGEHSKSCLQFPTQGLQTF
jgi:hypothetical protein